MCAYLPLLHISSCVLIYMSFVFFLNLHVPIYWCVLISVWFMYHVTCWSTCHSFFFYLHITIYSCVLIYVWCTYRVVCSTTCDSDVTYHYSFMRAYPCMIQMWHITIHSCVLIHVWFTSHAVCWSTYHSPLFYFYFDLYITFYSCVLIYIWFMSHLVCSTTYTSHVAVVWIRIPLFIHRYRGTLPQAMADSWYCVDRVVPEGMSHESAYHYSFTDTVVLICVAHSRRKQHSQIQSLNLHTIIHSHCFLRECGTQINTTG